MPVLLRQPGGTGDDWRLHLAYDFTAGRLGQVRVTDRYGGERLAPFALRPGDIAVADNGYGYRASVAAAAAQRADVVLASPPPPSPGDGRRAALRRAGVAAGGRRRPGVARLVPVGAAALWRAAARDAAVARRG